jgi:hypothetical protein
MVDEKDSHEDSSNDEKDCEWIHSKHMDIWNDESSMIQKKIPLLLASCLVDVQIFNCS